MKTFLFSGILLFTLPCSAQVDSLEINLVQVNKNANSIVTHYVNGMYAVKFQGLKPKNYPEIRRHELIVPGQLYGSDKILKISSFRNLFLTSPFYEVQLAYSQVLEPKIIEYELRRIPFEKQDSFLIANNIRLEMREIEYLDSTRNDPRSISKNYKSELRYVKYNNFSAEPNEGKKNYETEAKRYRDSMQPFIDSLTSPFFISRTSVTNFEYGAFIRWVRDSLAISMLYTDLDPDEALRFLNIPASDLKTIDPNRKAENLTKYGYKYEAMYWKKGNVYEDYEHPEIQDALRKMYFPQPERFYKRREFDPRLFVYQSAAIQAIEVYPDTLAFEKDNSASNMEPLVSMYFWHPAYDNYPVVGLTEQQMRAYCDWYQRQINATLKNDTFEVRVSLPTSYHFELAMKRCVPLFERNLLDANCPSPFELKRNSNESAAFIRSVYFTSDALPANEFPLIRKINTWYGENKTLPIYHLLTGVSEFCNDPAPADSLGNKQITILGADFQTALIDKSENQYNTLFYKRFYRADLGFSTIGFRTVIHIVPKNK